MRGVLAISVVAGGLAGLGACFAITADGAVRTLDATAEDVDALHGVVVWHRNRGGRRMLMRRIAGRTSRVPGVPSSPAPINLDLGIDRRGRVVATYVRCRSLGGRCSGPFVVDVRRGGERRLRLPVPRGCSTPKVSSMWRTRVAYTLICPHNDHDGVHVARAGTARRVLPLTGGVEVDLGPRLLLANSQDSVWIASVAGRPCRRRLAPPDDPPGVAYRDAHLASGRAWWLHEVVEDFGGGDVLLAGAAIGTDCVVAAIERLRDLGMLIFEPWSEDFGLDGKTLYVVREFGTGAVSVPLAELPQR